MRREVQHPRHAWCGLTLRRVSSPRYRPDRGAIMRTKRLSDVRHGRNNRFAHGHRRRMYPALRTCLLPLPKHDAMLLCQNTTLELL